MSNRRNVDRLEPFRQRAESWLQDVAKRRRVSTVDPVADAIDYCAAELLATITEVESERDYYTVLQYARKVEKDPATVRRWIKRGKLKAEQTPDGDYRIPADGIAA